MAEPTIQTWKASDGYEFAYRRYGPVGAVRGEIVALHGIQSHGGWYIASSQWFAEQGWGVSFLDRRGSGLNQKDRGDCPNFRRLLDDIAEYTKSLNTKPIILVGISWGGKLAVGLQKRHPGLCDGLILVAPGLRPRVRPKLFRRLAIFARRIVHPTKRYPIPLNDPELFTADIGRREFIRTDPLALHQATSRLLFGSARMDIYLRIARRRVRVPTLVLLAGRDKIIDNRKTHRYVRRFRSDDVQVVEYPDAHHTLEFETSGPPFYDDVAQWLTARFGKRIDYDPS